MVKKNSPKHQTRKPKRAKATKDDKKKPAQSIDAKGAFSPTTAGKKPTKPGTKTSKKNRSDLPSDASRGTKLVKSLAAAALPKKEVGNSVVDHARLRELILQVMCETPVEPLMPAEVRQRVNCYYGLSVSQPPVTSALESLWRDGSIQGTLGGPYTRRCS
jgi:hypothetical protein